MHGKFVGMVKLGSTIRPSRCLEVPAEIIPYPVHGHGELEGGGHHWLLIQGRGEITEVVTAFEPEDIRVIHKMLGTGRITQD